MMSGDGWSWIAGASMMLIFWGGLAMLIVYVVRSTSTGRSRPEGRSQPDARSILAERFARGEISEEEYVERNRVLETDRERVPT